MDTVVVSVTGLVGASETGVGREDTVEGAEEGIGISLLRDLGIRGGKDGEEEGRGDLLVLREMIGGAVHLRDGLDL